MRIAIGSDHAGFRLKEHLKGTLERLGHTVEDLGTHSEESVDYPPFCFAVGRAVVDGLADRAIKVLKDPEQYRFLGNAARERVLERYEQKKCITQLVEYFKEVKNRANDQAFSQLGPTS